jgi:type II secretory pathway pseudopilin PulG
MTPRPAQARSGITLTEILISILIMGVGLISVATLFPIGLVRLRQAQQQSRSGLLAETAAADLGTKNLLYKPSFLQLTGYYGGLDPFLADNSYGTTITVPVSSGYVNATTLKNVGVPSYSDTGSGLPFCYDPLFWSVVIPNGTVPSSGVGRFGAGVVGTNRFLRADPDGVNGGLPSAHGLQRLTNFIAYGSTGSATWPYQFVSGAQGISYPYTLRDLVADTFVSQEDTVMQNNLTGQQILNNPSPNTSNSAASVVPMMTAVPMSINGGTPSVPGTQADWRYTWMFTGRQHDYTNGTVFTGDIVIMDSRPIGIDTVNSPATGTSSTIASGEIVLEAIFGFGSSLSPTPTSGYAVAADRIVLLRWPTAMPDPEIKAGSWIADVTYERDQATSETRAAYGSALPPAAPMYPMQRCHWYQVARKGDVVGNSINNVAYREMVVYTTTPLRSRTLLTGAAAGVKTPACLNVALFMPSVVNVFPRTVYIR